MIRLISNTKVQVFIICILVVLAYSNSLFNGFAIDDHLFIVDWQVTKDLKNIPQMFTKDFAPGMGEHSGVYRPLRTVFYAISYKLWGTNPFFYHLQALTVHIIIVIFIFFITDIIFKKRYLAFLAALLFGLHPVHTEAVDYLTASFDAISYIFFFGAFLFYLKATKYNIYNVYKNYNYYISLILAGLAFFTLEMTVVLPLLLLLYDFCMKAKVKNHLKKLLKIHAPYFFLAGVYLLIRVFLLHIVSRGEYLGGSLYITFLTMEKAWLKYLWLLIFPVNLSINPTIADGINSWVGPASLTDKLLSQSLFDKEVLLGILGVLGLLGMGIKLYPAPFQNPAQKEHSAKKRCWIYRKYPIVSFCTGWFFISLLPVSYIIPQGPIMQERYIYLASFGFVVIVGWLLGRLGMLGRLGGLVFLLALFYGIVTFQRNTDWQTGESIWFSLIKQIPNDPYANLVIGTYYEQNQKYRHALNYYQNAIKNKPDYYDAYLKIAQVTIKMDKWHRYQDGNLIFFYPKDWKVSLKENLINIRGGQNFKIELSVGDALNTDDYLKNQSENYGALLNQGKAYISYFDQAFVKVFNDQGVRKLQFFMFKNKKVLKVLVYPGDSALMKDFDIVISSLKIL